MNSSIDEELLEAARSNNFPEVLRLLSVGADVNAKNDDDKTPLHVACWKGHVAVVKQLVGHGANIEAKNISGCTPLHLASWEGHVQVVKALLSRRVNIEAKNNSGCAPLHQAPDKLETLCGRCESVAERWREHSRSQLSRRTSYPRCSE
jgi:ankyrin repeat protein